MQQTKTSKKFSKTTIRRMVTQKVQAGKAIMRSVKSIMWRIRADVTHSVMKMQTQKESSIRTKLMICFQMSQHSNEIVLCVQGAKTLEKSKRCAIANKVEMKMVSPWLNNLRAIARSRKGKRRIKRKCSHLSIWASLSIYHDQSMPAASWAARKQFL